MSRKIQDIEGIGSSYAKILAEQGINTTSQFLETCATKKGRSALSKQTSLSEGKLLKWTNMCDLFRINGVASQYAELLEASGVDTIKELRTRNAENLALKMSDVNADKNLCKSTPSVKMISEWIQQASELEPIVSY